MAGPAATRRGRAPGGTHPPRRGLRREELADLAGLSVDYVVRPEQGRATTPSLAVVTALARALQLTGAERDHLHRLACLLGDPLASPPQRRNFARDRFPVDGSPPCLARWPVIESASADADRAVVADLRRAGGRFPDDRDLSGLVDELSAGNARFAELWAQGAVATHREDSKTIEHPGVGPVTVNCDVLRDGDSELEIVIMTAEPGSEHESRLQLAAVTDPPRPRPAVTGWSPAIPAG